MDIGIDFDKLQEIGELEALLALHEEAKSYLEEYRWCKKVINCWYESAYSIYGKLGVFLFEIEPIDDSVDKFIWVIIGDLPTVYLDQSIKTGKEALDQYCYLMSEWADNILHGSSLDGCYPVEVEPTIEHAELLKSRIAFIKTQFLNEEE